MKLPFFSKKEKKEYFLALLLGEEKVSAVIFQEIHGTARVVGRHEEHLEQPLEDTPFDTWLKVLDKAIGTAEGSLPPNVQTQKTIFGVKENWVEDAKIKKEYLVKLKKASEALMITPIGFIVIHEAIAHLLAQQEGAPVSALLLEIGQKVLIISLIRAGRIIETRQEAIEVDSAKTADTLLHHFNYEVLPSRIIVLSDQQNHDVLSQSFISHTWSRALPFLHVPQVAILPKGLDAKAVFLGAATQMGFETITDKDVLHAIEIKGKEDTEVLKASDVSKEEDDIEEEEEGFGFVMGTDVREKKKESEEEETNEKEVPKENNRIEKVSNFVPVNAISSSPSFFNTILATISPIKKIIMHTIKKLYIPTPSLAFLKNTPFKNGGIILIAPVIVIILIAILASYVLLLKATVTLFVKPKIDEKTQTITLTTKDNTDFSRSTINAQAIDVTENGKITLPATGQKEVGTSAKGSITIYNKTSQKVTLPSGTIVTSPNNLTFSLEDSVTIASASGASDAFSSISPSTAKANVTATDIGKESNLPSSTVFSVKSFATSDVAGKNDTAFSGGTKKEVTVVSKNDINKAEDSLTKNLQDKAKNDMNQKIDNNTVLLPFTANTEFKTENTDKKANEEANSFTLSGTIAYVGVAYKKDDMQQFSKTLLQQDVSDSAFIQDAITYTLEDTKQEKGKITSTLHATISLLPKLDKEKITKDIAEKSFDVTQNILVNLPQVTSATIQLHPNIFFLPKTLPRLSHNITLVVKKE